MIHFDLPFEPPLKRARRVSNRGGGGVYELQVVAPGLLEFQMGEQLRCALVRFEKKQLASANAAKARISELLGLHLDQFCSIVLNGAVTPCHACRNSWDDKPQDSISDFCPHLACSEWWVVPKLFICLGKRLFFEFFGPKGKGARVIYCNYIASPDPVVCRNWAAQALPKLFRRKPHTPMWINKDNDNTRQIRCRCHHVGAHLHLRALVLITGVKKADFNCRCFCH
jgi:hypothetical protein